MRKLIIFGIAFSLFSWNCSSPKIEQNIGLKDVFKDYFLIGAALSGYQIMGFDTAATKLVVEQFNSISPENILKWDSIHPELNTYTFTYADSFFTLGQRNNMFIIGHTLVWHNQLPKWVFETDNKMFVSKDTLLMRMKNHILTVVGRYKGKINGWDVVNEALDENGDLRQNLWYKIAGEEYIEKAFEYAHQADPQAELYYNDYNIELPAKRAGAIKLIKKLKDKGIKIDGIGIQGHWHLNFPSTDMIDSAIAEFSSLGLKVMITELDINVLPRPENFSGANITDNFELSAKLNPYPESLPDSVEIALAKRYADIFRVFCKHKDAISRVTFWGVNDKQSWLNDWPIRGRTNYPLLFDRNYQPKLALDSIVKIVK